jgi:hypothetical protein
MEIKCLEIRDEGTTISMLAIKPTADNEAQRAVLRHAGYGDCPDRYVVLVGAHDWEGGYNPERQKSHTRQVAHHYVKTHWAELKDGDVVDVEFILGTRATPKESEIQKNYSDAEWARMTAGFPR